MASPSLSSDPFELRITSHGRLRNFVAFALKFIKENPLRPLVLHTLPVPGKAKENEGQDAMVVVDKHPDNNDHDVEEQKCAGSSEHPIKKQKFHASAATIPKLVSVVEITKREYLKWAKERRHTDKDHAALVDGRLGLHQYNQLETLQNLGLLPNDELEPDLAKILSGKNYLKQEHTPHLRVTLSVKALLELEEIHGATHQPPPIFVKSKSARAREKKRQRKEKQADVNNEEV